jgi:hypothetical protein
MHQPSMIYITTCTTYLLLDTKWHSFTTSMFSTIDGIPYYNVSKIQSHMPKKTPLYNKTPSIKDTSI